MDGLDSASGIALSAMKALSARLRVISENMANADSVATVAAGELIAEKPPFRNVLAAEWAQRL